MKMPLLLLMLGLQVTTGTVQVSVHRAGTNTPLSGVDVTLGTLAGATRALLKTDESGRVTFSNLPPGVYRLRVEREGYFRKDETFSPLYSSPPSARARLPLEVLTVSVPPLGSTQSVSIAMAPSGTISGRVIDKDGVPLKDFLVSAISIHYQNGRRILDEWNQIRTEANGEYRLPSLGPGDYYVRADLVQRNYSPTYYPAATDITKAVSISVRGGEEIGGIDLVRASPATFSVSGKVLNLPKSVPVTGQSVEPRPTFALIPHDAGIADFPFPVELPNDRATDGGDFVVRGIPPGSWDLLAIVTRDIRSITDQRHVVGRSHIEVLDKDVQDVLITMNSSSVTGHARMSTGGPVPIILRAMLIPRDNMPFNFLSHLTRAKTLSFPNGEFAFESVAPGKYSFHFEEIPAGFYLADVRQGARSIYDDGIIEVGNQASQPLEIVMGAGGGQIAGRVQGLPEKPVPQEYASARIVLVPAKRGNLALYQIQTLALDGRFSFAYLAPGDYKIFAFKALPDGAEKSPAFLARYETLGTSATISTGSVNDVLVPIIQPEIEGR